MGEHNLCTIQSHETQLPLPLGDSAACPSQTPSEQRPSATADSGGGKSQTSKKYRARYVEKLKQDPERLARHKAKVRASNQRIRERILANLTPAQVARRERRSWSPEKKRDYQNEQARAWYAKHRERVKERLKAQRIKNPEQAKAKDQRYRERHPETIRETARKSSARMRLNPYFRLVKNLRQRLYMAVRRKAALRPSRKEMFGCTRAELIAHLTALLEPGMMWENYGDWHVDHKIPCAHFNLLDPEEVRRCFHFTNLRPLWAVENIRKSDRILPEFAHLVVAA